MGGIVRLPVAFLVRRGVLFPVPDHHGRRRVPFRVLTATREIPGTRFRSHSRGTDRCMARFAWLALTVAACARPAASGSPPAAKASVPPHAESVALRPPEPPPGWVDAMRAEDFREAVRRLSELDAAQAGLPEVKYARARAAMGIADFKGA